MNFLMLAPPRHRSRRNRTIRLRSLAFESLERRRLLAANLSAGQASSSAPSSAEAELVSSPWTNSVNRFDVNGDGFVNSSDALLAILARGNAQIVGQECADASLAGETTFCVLPLPKPAGLPFVDVTGDGLITDSDGAQIQAFLAFNAGSTPASIFVSPEPRHVQLTTTELGGTALIAVSLISPPTADVMISVRSSNPNEGTVSTDMLTFRPADGTRPQQVIVTGMADGIDDGNQSFTIIFGDAVSDDPVYNGLPVANIPITNLKSGDVEVSQISSMVAVRDTNTIAAFHVHSSLAGKLDAWIDFNGNGNFDHPAEHLGGGVSIDLVAGSNIITVEIPAGSVTGDVAARFRVSSAGGLLPSGAATVGKVEDYLFHILDGDAGADVVLLPPNGSGRLDIDALEVVAITESIEVFRVPGAALNSIAAFGNDDDNLLELGNLDAAFAGLISVDAGEGTDTLRLIGSNQTLDLTSLPAGTLAGIEVIDLAGSGNHSLVLSVGSVEFLSDTTDTLKLIYGAGDSVNFNQNWQVQKPEIIAGQFQHVLTSNSSTARIEITNAFAHQNPLNPFDVNRRDGVSVIDALLVINALSRNEGGTVTTPTTEVEIPSFYLDVSGDNEITVIDALRVINRLALGGGPEAESPDSLPAHMLPPYRDENVVDKQAVIDLLSHDRVAMASRQDERKTSWPNQAIHFFPLTHRLRWESQVNGTLVDSSVDEPSRVIDLPIQLLLDKVLRS